MKIIGRYNTVFASYCPSIAFRLLISWQNLVPWRLGVYSGIGICTDFTPRLIKTSEGRGTRNPSESGRIHQSLNNEFFLNYN